VKSSSPWIANHPVNPTAPTPKRPALSRKNQLPSSIPCNTPFPVTSSCRKIHTKATCGIEVKKCVGASKIKLKTHIIRYKSCIFRTNHNTSVRLFDWVFFCRIIFSFILFSEESSCDASKRNETYLSNTAVPCFGIRLHAPRRLPFIEIPLSLRQLSSGGAIFNDRCCRREGCPRRNRFASLGYKRGGVRRQCNDG
jgi:hypothetical protein